MQESLITFETAKLAQEKGYKNHDCKQYDTLGLSAVKGFVMNPTAAPTQSLLQKWLREVHDIDITILPYGQIVYRCNLYKNKVFIKAFGLNDNHDELLEFALKESLKLIPEIT